MSCSTTAFFFLMLLFNYHSNTSSLSPSAVSLLAPDAASCCITRVTSQMYDILLPAHVICMRTPVCHSRHAACYANIQQVLSVVGTITCANHTIMHTSVSPLPTAIARSTVTAVRNGCNQKQSTFSAACATAIVQLL